MNNSQIAQIINSLPEAQALTTLQAVGFSPEAAAAEIVKAKKTVEHDEVQSVLKDFKDAIVKQVVETSDASLTNSIPDDIEELKVGLFFTRIEKKLPNDQTVAPGFYTEAIAIKRKDDEGWISLSKRGRSGSGGTGGGGGVPVPTDAPFTKWTSYISDFTNYHQDKDSDDKDSYVPMGVGYSAPAGLKKVGDELFAEAARIYTEESRPATWEEVKEYA